MTGRVFLKCALDSGLLPSDHYGVFPTLTSLIWYPRLSRNPSMFTDNERKIPFHLLAFYSEPDTKPRSCAITALFKGDTDVKDRLLDSVGEGEVG